MRAALLLVALGQALVMTSACGSGSSINSPGAGCLSCAEKPCAAQAATCRSTAGCGAGVDCLLGCAHGDTACSNKCVAASAQNNAAVVAGAAYYQCLYSTCPDACSPSSGGGGGAGGGGGPQGGAGGGGGNTTGSGGHIGAAGTTGSGGASGPQGVCLDLLAWATGCAVDTEATFRSCDASKPLDACEANCYLGAHCSDYTNLKAGVVNDLATCITACIITYSPTKPPATCANAKAKLQACSTPIPSLICDDTNREDQCTNACIVNTDCTLIYADLETNIQNAFSNCLNGCNGGTPTPGFTVGDGGYVTTGSWAGYAFTGTDGKSLSTILPVDFMGVLAGGQLCASGIVDGTPDYSAVAFLGLNLNQALAGGAGSALTWTPTGAGIAYDVEQPEGVVEFRIQIQAVGGDTNENLRWCAITTTDAGSIGWSSFNTHCWDGSGATYNGTTPLVSAMVLVPGDIFDLPFELCLNKFAPL